MKVKRRYQILENGIFFPLLGSVRKHYFAFLAAGYNQVMTSMKDRRQSLMNPAHERPRLLSSPLTILKSSLRIIKCH